MKRIMILMTDAGGGHRASAEALRDAFQIRYGDSFHIDIVDLWMKHTPVPLNQVPKTYRFLVNDTPRLYEYIFSQTEEKVRVTDALLDTAYKWARRPLSKAFRQYAPDLVISVHPLMQEIPMRVMGKIGLEVPFVTVVTDLVRIHPSWLHKEVTLCFVPTEEAYELALCAGLQPEQVRPYGLPVRPAFAQELPQKEPVRQKLGMEPDLPAALLVGGGEGVGPVAKIARAVAEQLAAAPGGLPAGQLVVICGRNKKLYSKMVNHEWPVPTIVGGFVKNMPEWMSGSDCIITKAGPGTIAESLITGLPLILSGYIVGQEEGNVPFVLDHEVGVYSEDPLEIAQTVRHWFGPGRQELAGMSERARRMGRPRSSFHIVEEIARLAGVEATHG